VVAIMPRALQSKAIRRLRRFRDEEDGVSAVEFAMLLPLLITLYLGSIEVTQAVSADRKMTLVAGTVGDLVAQVSCVSAGDIAAVSNAGKAVLYPFDSTNLTAVVTSVTFDANLTGKVAWSQALAGSTPRVAGTNVTDLIPAALRVANDSVIWAEASYKYVPLVGRVIAPAGITLSEKIFLKPRLGKAVSYSASSC
jgi:Flp pilus assembly protein TadG